MSSCFRDESRIWPFGVTWRHRSRDHLIPLMPFPIFGGPLWSQRRIWRNVMSKQLPASFRQPHCIFTLLLAHLILRISPHHSHPYVRSHHLSLPRPFIPDLKLISFTNPFLRSHSYSFRTDFTVLNLYCIRPKGALALFVLVSFSAYVC